MFSELHKADRADRHGYDFHAAPPLLASKRAKTHWLPELDAKVFGNKWLLSALLRELSFRKFKLADMLSLTQDENSVIGE